MLRFCVPQQLPVLAPPQLQISVLVCLWLYRGPHLAAEHQAEETAANPRKELRAHFKPSVRTYVFAAPSDGNPQLRSRVKADAPTRVGP